MKSKLLKFAGTLMIIASATALTFMANDALAYPEADCDTYCQYSTSFDCVISYSDGGTQRCYFNKPNGTFEEQPT